MTKTIEVKFSEKTASIKIDEKEFILENLQEFSIEYIFKNSQKEAEFNFEYKREKNFNEDKEILEEIFKLIGKDKRTSRPSPDDYRFGGKKKWTYTLYIKNSPYEVLIK